MVKKYANILIITFAVFLFILTKTLISKNVQMLMLIKTTEVFSCGIIAWLFSKFIHQRVNNGILRVLFMFLFGAIIYAVPTYVKIFTWCCKTSELSIITQMSVSNYIFLNRIFGTYILQTGFWIVFYSIIYILGGVSSRMKSKKQLHNRNSESSNMKNDDKLICDSHISFVDMPHNRPEK